MRGVHRGWAAAAVAIVALAAVTLAPGVGWADAPHPNGGVATPAGSGAPRSLAGRALAVDAGWTLIQWSGAGAPFTLAETFSYSAGVTTYVTLVDSFCPGDRFRIRDSGGPAATTTYPKARTCTQFSGDDAYRDARFSRGTLVLAPGSHTITIDVLDNPWAGGAAYLRVDTRPFTVGSPTPSPSATPAPSATPTPVPTPTPAPTLPPKPRW